MVPYLTSDRRRKNNVVVMWIYLDEDVLVSDEN